MAYGGAQEYYGVIPDLCTMGKIVGGGYPLAIVAGREELMSAFDPSTQETRSFVPQIGTLNGNPVAAAAGLATLAELRKEGAYDKLHSFGARLKEGIAQVFSEAEIPVVVSGEAPIFGFMFTDQPVNDYRDTLKADAGKMVEFTRLLLDQGLLKGWPEKMYVSLAHEHEIDATLEVVPQSGTTVEGLAGNLVPVRVKKDVVYCGATVPSSQRLDRRLELVKGELYEMPFRRRQTWQIRRPRDIGFLGRSTYAKNVTDLGHRVRRQGQVSSSAETQTPCWRPTFRSCLMTRYPLATCLPASWNWPPT